MLFTIVVLNAVHRFNTDAALFRWRVRIRRECRRHRGEDSAWGEGRGRGGSFVRPRHFVPVVCRRGREISADTVGVGLCHLESVYL